MMGALTRENIFNRLNKDLFIRPLLSVDKQINEASIDFRLGYDFMVNVHSRDAYMNASLNSELGTQLPNLRSFFQESRRQLGETFILHPHQPVLAVSLEYVRMPDDVFMLLFMRSSYSRLGLSISTILQPGYCGCISIELINNGTMPINLTVGARIIQGVLVHTDNSTTYFKEPRKYVCQVRPESSVANNDQDLNQLNTIWRKDNHII